MTARMRAETEVSRVGAKPLLWVLFGIAVCPFVINGWVNARIAAQPIGYWAFEILTWALIPIAVFAIARRNGGPSLNALGFSQSLSGRPNPAGLFGWSAIAALAAPALYHLGQWLSYTLFGGRTGFSYADVLPADGAAKVLVLVWFALSAAVVEETLYRAYGWYLIAACQRPHLVYLLCGPPLFALVHWEGGLASIAASWLYGLVAAAVYLALRNLWPLVVGHFVTDLLAFS